MLKKADEHLKSSKILIEMEQYRDAVSRAYYGAFSAVCAYMGGPLKGRWKHDGIRIAFSKKLYNEGVDGLEARNLTRKLKNLYDNRRIADYEIDSIEGEIAEDFYTNAEYIFLWVKGRVAYE